MNFKIGLYSLLNKFTKIFSLTFKNKTTKNSNILNKTEINSERDTNIHIGDSIINIINNTDSVPSKLKKDLKVFEEIENYCTDSINYLKRIIEFGVPVVLNKINNLNHYIDSFNHCNGDLVVSKFIDEDLEELRNIFMYHLDNFCENFCNLYRLPENGDFDRLIIPKVFFERSKKIEYLTELFNKTSHSYEILIKECKNKLYK